jgi:hypothetical protein
MDKEAQLQALRNLHGVNRGLNSLTNVKENVNEVKVSDIEVMKYLDTLKRRATALDEVQIIDCIVQCLFYQGRNRVTGRVHGERVANEPELSPTAPIAVSCQDAKAQHNAYHREYMRKRRERLKGG